jgi:hypothetical protein
MKHRDVNISQSRVPGFEWQSTLRARTHNWSPAMFTPSESGEIQDENHKHTLIQWLLMMGPV